MTNPALHLSRSMPAIEPKDLDAERAVLSGILVGETLPAAIAVRVEAWMFADPTHRLWYESAQRLAARGAAIDPVTWRAEMGADLDRAGGVERLAEFIDVVPKADHLAQHADLVRQAALRRQLAQTAEALAVAAQNPRITLPELDQAVNCLRAPREWIGAQAFQPATLEEFATVHRPDVHWIVKGYAARGNVTLIAGHAKTGKTTFCADLGAAVTAGTEFIGHPTESGAALWIDCREQPDHLISMTLTRAGFAAGQLYVHSGALPDLTAAAAWCRTHNAAVVVIDSLAKAWLGVEDESDAVQTGRALQPFLDFAQVANVALILIHHLRKSGGAEGLDVRGSSAIMAAVDVAVGFRRFNTDALEQDCRRVLFGFGRYMDVTPYKLVLDRRAGRYRACGTPSEVRRRDEREKILTVLTGKGQSAEAIATAAGFSPSAIRTVLKGLVEEPADRCLVDRTGSGKRGDPYLYILRTARTTKSVLRAVNEERESNPLPGDVEARY